MSFFSSLGRTTVNRRHKITVFIVSSTLFPAVIVVVFGGKGDNRVVEGICLICTVVVVFFLSFMIQRTLLLIVLSLCTKHNGCNWYCDAVQLQSSSGFVVVHATTPELQLKVKAILNESSSLNTNNDRVTLGSSPKDGAVVQFVAVMTKTTSSAKDKDVTEKDNAVIGCVFCQTKNPSVGISTTQFRSPYVYLYNLHVQPSQRQQGVGTALIQAVVEYARKEDSQGVLLSVDTDNARNAVRIYERLGFEISGARFQGETPMFRPT